MRTALGSIAALALAAWVAAWVGWLPGDELRAAWSEAWGPQGSTLAHVGWAAAGVASALLGGLVLRQTAARRARRALPLVIGGWGTRGKSGTERKKAALISALGARFVSKTTGCEAMVIVGDGMEEARELNLFRPHDKATIWEQVDVLETAAALESDVLLWECMALQPDYVEVLQSVWMHDDLSTVVNAYPDHLDVQGPTGRDVAETISQFIPERGRVFTAEISFRPVLEQRARERGAVLESLDRFAGLQVTSDVLERFPYRVHPRNLALVVRLGAELEVERDWVLKEVAEHLIPDLGVLETYPSRTRGLLVEGREVRFSNSMSANERAGTLSNWARLGLADEPDWVVVVINNRADRVPRSEEFAGILVEDVAFHRLVLIGTNLEGLQGYLEEALEGRLARLRGPEDPSRWAVWSQEVLARDAARLRAVPRDRAALWEALRQTLGASLEEDTEQFEEVEVRLGRELEAEEREAARGLWESYHAYAAHAAALEELEAGDAQGHTRWLEAHRAWVRRWFVASWVVVEDPWCSGPEVTRRVARAAPPRARVHAVGVQNIKGTGLDFAQRWVATGAWERALQRLASLDPSKRARGAQLLERLEGLEDYERAYLEARLADLEDGAAGTDRAPELRRLREGLPPARPRTTAAVADGWGARVAGWSEPVLDVAHTLQRSRAARRITQALRAGHTTLEEVEEGMAALTKEQKGGWLVRQARRWGAG